MRVPTIGPESLETLQDLGKPGRDGLQVRFDAGQPFVETHSVGLARVFGFWQILASTGDPTNETFFAFGVAFGVEDAANLPMFTWSVSGIGVRGSLHTYIPSNCGSLFGSSSEADQRVGSVCPCQERR